MSDDSAIGRAAAMLAAGDVVAFPTETVYGLGADATNPLAIARIFALKGRPSDHPLIVHIADLDALPPLVRDVPDAARALAERFWPGPLTLVLPRSSAVPDEGGNAWVVTNVAVPLAASRLWRMLLEPRAQAP